MLKKLMAAMVLFLYATGTAMAAGSIISASDIPYFLGQKRSEIIPGESVQIRIVLESGDKNPNSVPVKIYVPTGFIPLDNYEYWQVNRQGDAAVLQTEIMLQGGYDQWFDLVAVKASSNLAPGMYKFYVEANGAIQEYPVAVGEKTAEVTHTDIQLTQVVFPLDKDGKKDARIDANTLVLRDKTLDYFRNIMRGKGAANLAEEVIHPVSYARLDILNPAGEQKLVTVTARLLDYQTRQQVQGLITPKATGEDVAGDGGVVAAQGSQVFMALTGETRQRVLLPLYSDDSLTAGGKYWLQLSLEDGVAPPLVTETEVTIVKKNMHAIVVVTAAWLVLFIGLFWGLPRLRDRMRELKTRWLITVALFGTTTFACVNVPSTILGDFFHILLGPFSFLITGVFTGVFLYMLMISLIVLIPRPGIITLAMAIRMLLGMLVFGNISLISILSYGLQALLLELALYPFYRYGVCTADNLPAIVRQALPIAVACAITDCLATYTSIQASIFLYRMYFADWYIYLVLLFNGLLYTMLGAVCGCVLGRQLVKIRGD